MRKICEILSIEKDSITDEQIKLLIGDMELSFSELISCVNYSKQDDKFYLKLMGEVTAYLNCLLIMNIITKQQHNQMQNVFEQMEDMRQRNKKFYLDV